LRYGERSVLLYSPNTDVRYHTGFIDADGRFITEKSGTLDYSGKQGFYAPNTLLNDPKGRYITWGWITEQSRNAYPIQGYNGALSLPRILSLVDDSTRADSSQRLDSSQLLQTPAEEINAFLSEPIEQIIFSLSGGERELKTRVTAAEIRLTAFLEKGDDFSLNVYKSPDGRECTRLHYDHEKRELTLEKGLSSLDGNPSKDFQRAKLSVIDKNSKKLDLRIFLDHSIIEIFANNETVITGRVYPVLEDSSGVSLSGRAAEVMIIIRRVTI
jgi:beta-fructofuranosidase